jgi:PadR family transcriptional regulator, regulatory protein PadR
MRKDGTLGAFEQYVMLSLLRLRNTAYGRTIHDDMVNRLGRNVSLGAIYVALGRLEEKGFVTSDYGGADARRGGRAKRYFQLTGLGERVLSDTLKEADRMRHGLGDAIGALP